MANTTNFNWETPDDTDLVKDGALAIRTLGNSIDTTLVDLKGGTTGQVLSKTSNTDMDFTWVTSDDANAIQNTIVDAKGDLISASAADVPARLAVGNNGDTLVADSSTSTGLRYNPQNALANPFINGGFDVWQRGTSFSVTGGNLSFYTADRWQGYRAVSGLTVSRQTTSDTTNLPNIQYGGRFQRDSGNTATNIIYAAYSMENAQSTPLIGKTFTISFYAKRGANYSEASNALLVSLGTGTGTDQNFISGFTGYSSAVSQSVVLTTSYQRFAITGTLSSSGTQIGMHFSYSPSGTAGANDWFEITGVQIDIGTYTASTAPTFRRAGGTLAGELAACQRYYWRETGINYYAAGYCTNTTIGDSVVPFPVIMRTQPTLSSNSGTNYFAFTWSGGNNTASAPTFFAAGTKAALVRITTTGLTTGQGGYAQGNNAAAYIEASAEL